MYDRNKINNLARYIDAVLQETLHTRDEIVCVLWGGEGREIGKNSISLDINSFWAFAENYCWDNDEWASGPPYPMALVSNGGWWIEATEYDCRTDLRFMEKPKVKPAKLFIGTDGNLCDMEA